MDPEKSPLAQRLQSQSLEFPLARITDLKAQCPIHPNFLRGLSSKMCKLACVSSPVPLGKGWSFLHVSPGDRSVLSKHDLDSIRRSVA